MAITIIEHYCFVHSPTKCCTYENKSALFLICNVYHFWGISKECLYFLFLNFLFLWLQKQLKDYTSEQYNKFHFVIYIAKSSSTQQYVYLVCTYNILEIPVISTSRCTIRQKKIINQFIIFQQTHPWWNIPSLRCTKSMNLHW